MTSTTSRQRLFGLAALLAVLAFVLAACGGDPTPTPVPTSTPVPLAAGEPTLTPTATPDAAALFQVEWDALIAAAQVEGEVVLVFGGSAGRNYRPVAEFWQDKFGVKAIVSTGSGSEQGERILAEQRAGQYEVDIMMIGATTGSTRLIPAGAVEPVA